MRTASRDGWSESLHGFVAQMLFISLGASELVACVDAAAPTRPTTPKSFSALAETSPDIVADAIAGSDLTTRSVPLPVAQCHSACGADSTGCDASVVVRGDPNRPTQIIGELSCHFPEPSGGGDWDPFHLNSCPFGCGRRPPSFRPLAHDPQADPFVLYVRSVVHLEEQSVVAFEQIANDLRVHAPHFLPRIARAQRDERRHAREARRILRELGGTPFPVARARHIDRMLDVSALENAVEGCIHETFGAMAVCVQARRARHPSLRRFLRRIAVDEVEHAALSWDIHDHLWPSLTPKARAKIKSAQICAVERIAAQPSLPERARVLSGSLCGDEQSWLASQMRRSIVELERP